MEYFTAKWFVFYYFILGLVAAFSGLMLVIKVDACAKYLVSEIKTDEPPAFLRSILKYFFIFTIPCFIFSFFPFYWFELLFAIWSFIIVFLIGLQLVRWPHTRLLLENHPQKIRRVTQWGGALLIIISLVIILLGYQELQRFLPIK